mmetsp:Transcript_7642/g.13521  ORF Transcript_7642/g.13521 Transcript_7642/m.13521 type:complete len:213 (-) Transcript_7642:280-918(-)
MACCSPSRRFGIFAVSAAALVGLPLATDDNDDDASANETVVYDAPVCGYSKRNLDEDPVRRHCLQQCILSPDGSVQPTFSEWEDYCRETAGMAKWDTRCSEFYCCMYDCDIWGSDSTVCRTADPATRYEMLVETRANMYSAGITRQKRCILEKCSAYCAKRVFQTCRETQYVQKCEKSNPLSYGCDVDCNAAWRQVLPGWAVLALLGLALGR